MWFAQLQAFRDLSLGVAQPELRSKHDDCNLGYSSHDSSAKTQA